MERMWGEQKGRKLIFLPGEGKVYLEYLKNDTV
jgi:hypothetical protein